MSISTYLDHRFAGFAGALHKAPSNAVLLLGYQIAERHFAKSKLERSERADIRICYSRDSTIFCEVPYLFLSHEEFAARASARRSATPWRRMRIRAVLDLRTPNT
ncbi:hypothetical protein FUT87_07350 [Mitsuaria sp. TWR114]|uniref:hypothetical protein n=1 Tax=Mitsuaria sp. TWR114 TaxID=2601731 RepID=UPI0011BFDE56|nr:hypothetical protein [Mitsuaria sp. TWR114]TXD94217.1 hypothetical protein FUT87_07350 [Mitsuaria sp. TWR114]